MDNKKYTFSLAGNTLTYKSSYKNFISIRHTLDDSLNELLDELEIKFNNLWEKGSLDEEIPEAGHRCLIKYANQAVNIYNKYSLTGNSITVNDFLNTPKGRPGSLNIADIISGRSTTPVSSLDIWEKQSSFKGCLFRRDTEKQSKMTRIVRGFIDAANVIKDILFDELNLNLITPQDEDIASSILSKLKNAVAEESEKGIEITEEEFATQAATALQANPLNLDIYEMYIANFGDKNFELAKISEFAGVSAVIREFKINLLCYMLKQKYNLDKIKEDEHSTFDIRDVFTQNISPFKAFNKVSANVIIKQVQSAFRMSGFLGLCAPPILMMILIAIDKKETTPEEESLFDYKILIEKINTDENYLLKLINCVKNKKINMTPESFNSDYSTIFQDIADREIARQLIRMFLYVVSLYKNENEISDSEHTPSPIIQSSSHQISTLSLGGCQMEDFKSFNDITCVADNLRGVLASRYCQERAFSAEHLGMLCHLAELRELVERHNELLAFLNGVKAFADNNHCDVDNELEKVQFFKTLYVNYIVYAIQSNRPSYNKEVQKEAPGKVLTTDVKNGFISFFLKDENDENE